MSRSYRRHREQGQACASSGGNREGGAAGDEPDRQLAPGGAMCELRIAYVRMNCQIYKEKNVVQLEANSGHVMPFTRRTTTGCHLLIDYLHIAYQFQLVDAIRKNPMDML
ncbi:hypothetical protein J5N97_019874 [Dioscorea zingiberensis]|uniref:Uncharacterized protein n=1 Tax=Dioscorea zingiberensis TaxID=325984 RepID=A0A9D5CFF6_9LILI|nr:hypothetical protein J5N97_019874 [Dioscorea zingiberensis]